MNGSSVKKQKNARMCAFDILYKTENDKAFSNIALKEGLRGSGLAEADRRLVTTIVYGCVKYRRYLDYIISRYSSVRLKKLSLNVLLILRMGIYQIMKLDRVPDSAAVDESVKLAAKKAYRSKAFVNAVLRAAASGKDTLVLPKDKNERLCVEYSYPDELAEMWIDEFGYGFAEELMAAGNESPSVTVRVNRLKTDSFALTETLAAENVKSQRTDAENMLTVGGSDIGALKSYRGGLFTPQGMGSYFACMALGPKSGDTVIDLCAAPGGKSTHIAELMKNEGKIYSFDVHEHKIELIKSNAKRLGIDIIEAHTADSSVYMKEFDSAADAVLADVPCSGLGIIRKKPDIKWGFDINLQKQLSQLQYEILSAGARYVKHGGTLVYSTCTVSHTENIDVVKRFLESNGEFCMCPFDEILPGKYKKDGAKSGYVQFYPNVDGIDGFFICKMKRK